MKRQRTDKDGTALRPFGYPIDENGAVIRQLVVRNASDYGADPLGDGTYRMVPSGDIVSLEERNKRLRAD